MPRSHNAVAELTAFAANVPGALRRRAFGKRFVQAHPEFEVGVRAPNVDAIVSRLKQLAPDVDVARYAADPARFAHWVERARYPFWLYPFPSSRNEKYLEHQISVDLLAPPPGGTLIDVACGGSYFGVIMQRQGFRTIDQDLAFPPGLHGEQLGGDAADMALPDNSADGMTLHCSFEHFEGDSDSRFVRECARVLRPGGRTVIIPLYLSDRHFIVTDPYHYTRESIPFDEGAKPVMLVGYSNRHGRHYDVQAFVSRVIQPACDVGLVPTLTVIENTAAISPFCYVRFALTLQKK